MDHFLLVGTVSAGVSVLSVLANLYLYRKAWGPANEAVKLRDAVAALENKLTQLQGRPDCIQNTDPLPSPKERSEFIKKHLEPLKKYPEQIADKRYTGDWGPFDPSDSRKSSWKVRQANRYITELNHHRDLRPVKISIYVGLFAVAATILAIPSKDSLFAMLRDLVRLIASPR